MKKILFPARGLNRDRCIPLCTTFSGWALGTELRRLNGSRHSNVVVYLTQSGDRLRRSVTISMGRWEETRGSTGWIKAGTRITINCYKEPVGHFTHIWSVLRHYHGSASNSAVSPVVGLITRAARVRSRVQAGIIRCTNLALYIRDCESLCLSDETVKAVGPFYLVSMPGEVKYPTQGVNM